MIDWANESFAIAKQAYQPAGRTGLLQAGAKLGADYEQAFLHVANEQVAPSLATDVDDPERNVG